MIKIHEFATIVELTGPDKELYAISERLRVRPPRYWMSKAYELWRKTSGKVGWDGYDYPLKRIKERWLAARGHVEAIVEEAGRLAIDVDVSQRRTSPFHGLTIDDVPDDILPGAEFELDHLQRECVVELLRHATGTIRATVSSGKTAIFWSVAAMVKRLIPQARILYVTPTERLVNQVYKEGVKFLPDWSISQFGGGVRELDGKDAVVCTAASVHANYDELNEDGWLRSFTVLLLDEVHRSTSDSWQQLAKSVPAFFRFGASDGLKDERPEDASKWLVIRGLTGPRRATIDAHPLIAAGRVASPYLHLIDPPDWAGKFDKVPYVVEPGTKAWTLIDHIWVSGTYIGPATTIGKDGNEVQKLGYHQLELADGREVQVESRLTVLHRAYDQAVIQHHARNQLIVDWTKHFVAQDWPTLVVASRTPHVLILDGLLRRAGLEVEVLTGQHDSRERDEVFSWLTAGPPRVLVSGIVKEGVSLPELKAGVVADVVVSPDLARQIIGRFVRKKPDGHNQAHVAWFIDRTYPSARRGCKKLFEELEKLRGYSFYHPCHRPGEGEPKLYQAASLD